MKGVVFAKSSKSSNGNSIPTRPAIAIKWMMAFVEPPLACKQRIAFSKADKVKIFDGINSVPAKDTALRPASSAICTRRESTAGIEALSGKAIPIASPIIAMVDAVPIVMQWPELLTIQLCNSAQSSSVMFPALNSTSYLLQSVHDPNSSPFQFPFNWGPPVTSMDGMSALAAPINRAGVVLSHPPRRTTASIGFAVIDSSTSILNRFRYSIVVGLMLYSPRDITGNSKGNPPACHTPRLTASANPLRWALQCVSSLQVLHIPIIGFPSYEASP